MGSLDFEKALAVVCRCLRTFFPGGGGHIHRPSILMWEDAVNQFTTKVLLWYSMMYGCFKTLPNKEKKALERWETFNGCTSDWPGWEKYIGKRPAPPPCVKIKTAFVSSHLKLLIFKRDGYKCVWCSSAVDLVPDHIVPSSRGGPTTIDNLRTLCAKCNNSKGRRLDSEMKKGGARELEGR